MLDYSRVIQVIGGSFVGLGPILPPPTSFPGNSGDFSAQRCRRGVTRRKVTVRASPARFRGWIRGAHAGVGARGSAVDA